MRSDFVQALQEQADPVQLWRAQSVAMGWKSEGGPRPCWALSAGLGIFGLIQRSGRAEEDSAALGMTALCALTHFGELYSQEDQRVLGRLVRGSLPLSESNAWIFQKWLAQLARGDGADGDGADALLRLRVLSDEGLLRGVDPSFCRREKSKPMGQKTTVPKLVDTSSPGLHPAWLCWSGMRHEEGNRLAFEAISKLVISGFEGPDFVPAWEAFEPVLSEAKEGCATLALSTWLNMSKQAGRCVYPEQLVMPSNDRTHPSVSLAWKMIMRKSDDSVLALAHWCYDEGHAETRWACSKQGYLTMLEMCAARPTVFAKIEAMEIARQTNVETARAEAPRRRL